MGLVDRLESQKRELVFKELLGKKDKDSRIRARKIVV